MLDEYYTNFYGPAAAEMKAYIEYCEQNWPAMSVKPEPIDKAFELIARAREAGAAILVSPLGLEETRSLLEACLSGTGKVRA